MPEPAGSGSDIVTALAVPVPAADELETATVKPIADPALTLAASAVFTMLRAGARAVVFAVDVGVPVLVPPAVAVLVYVPALAAVVALVMCTDAEAPAAMSPKAHERFWFGTVP